MIGIATPAFIVALPLFLLWMVVIGILVFRRAGRPTSAQTAPGDSMAGIANSGA